MNEIQLEEYRFLRDELNANRKLVFERPLIVAGVTFAAAFAVSKHGLLGVLPLPFLIVLLFNLWFTANRLRSSARIIAYVQMVHEGSSLCEWIGWESALRKYREWLFEHREDQSETEADDDFKQYDYLAYYGPIYSFHLSLGLILTALLIGQSQTFERLTIGTASGMDIALIVGNICFALGFVFASLIFRPRKLRHGIELQRKIWSEVLKMP